MTLHHNAPRQPQTETTAPPPNEGSDSSDSADEDTDMRLDRRSSSLSPFPSGCGGGDYSPSKDDHPSPSADGQQRSRTCHDNVSSTPQNPNCQSSGLPSGLPELRVLPCLASHQAVCLLSQASPQPPVTTETLKELDLYAVQNNIELRIDINYNHELHFMPIAGQRAEKKRQEASRYWLCLELELCLYQHNAQPSCSDCQAQQPEASSIPVITFAPRLRTMFEVLRSLLLILVPEYEHDDVEQTFDLDLLMQQVHNNALDIERLSLWLKRLLTSHCAPVRDACAKEMSTLLCDGARQGDYATIAAGLAKLFALCEAMKLDVSNHQVQTFRSLLIDDGVAFQRDLFSSRVRNNKLDIASSHRWFACHEQSLLAKTAQIQDGLAVLVEGLAELCAVPGLCIPVTFKHDTARIIQIREEIQDIISLGICVSVFERAFQRLTGITANLSPMHGILKTRIMDLTDAQVVDSDIPLGTPTTIVTDPWQSNIEAISLEIARAVSLLARRAQNVTVPPPNMQLYVANELARSFQAEKSNQEHLTILTRELKQRISDHAAAFRKLSVLNLSEVQRHFQQTRRQKIKSSVRLLPDVNDIARRIAHMAVIHWEVWWDIAYRRL